MLKLKIILSLLLFAIVAKSQLVAKPNIDTVPKIVVLSFPIIEKGQLIAKPNIDATSKIVTTLFNQKKYTTVLSVLNKLIADNPSAGINYFNRAVVNFYKKGKYNSYDPLIMSDCIKAKLTGYGNPELFYLLFCQFQNCGDGYICNYIPINEDRYVQVYFKDRKKLIDTAINIDPWNEKYLWGRIQLILKTNIFTFFFSDSFKEYQEYIPTLKRDCESVIGLTKNIKTKSLAYHYLSIAYQTYYSDSLKAIQCLSATIDLDPKNDDAYKERGILRTYFNNDQKGAIADFSIYLSKWLDPDIYFERGVCYGISSDYGNAIKDLNIAIDLFEQQRSDILKSVAGSTEERLKYQMGKWAKAYNMRGSVNEFLGNKEAALKDYNKAIEYGSKDAQISKTDLLENSNQNQDNTQNSELTSNSIAMIKKGGVYEIPITINNTLKINFIFDAGASDVSLSADVALTLIRTGTVSDKDFIGTQTYKFADGSTAKSKVFFIKELQIGSRKVTNVRATISNSLEAPLLLGQSALNRFGIITIDYKNSVIHFED